MEGDETAAGFLNAGVDGVDGLVGVIGALAGVPAAFIAGGLADGTFEALSGVLLVLSYTNVGCMINLGKVDRYLAVTVE